jgi:hypothetical protein
MTCSRRYRKRLIDYTDGLLDEAASEKMRSHLETCEECTRSHELLMLSHSALSSLQTVTMPEDASARVLSNISSSARGRVKPVASSRFEFLTSPRTMAAAGTAAAVLIAVLLVVLVYTGPTTTRQSRIPTTAMKSSVPTSESTTPAGTLDQGAASAGVPDAIASIVPVVKHSATNYDENSLKGAFDAMALKKEISQTCTMGHAVSMGGLFKRKMADMMVDAGSDGAMLEAMITYLTTTEPVLLPYYAEDAMFTGQPVYIIGLAGPRRMGTSNKLTRTEVWVMSPQKFAASPDSSIVYFLEEKTE